tara:strand:- start:2281 stop:3297 length:1017 start_codon:yes stop_codon:yes gene_type:complete
MNNLKALKLQRKYKFFFDNLSYLEDFIIGNNKNKKSYSNKHIFLTGMPRSGTTILTHILSRFNDVGSYNYSDLPFFKIPYFWSKINKFYYFKNKKLIRPHGDGLNIDISSPDAFEELIWSENLENYNLSGFFKYLDERYENKILKSELIRNINKILIVRKKKIYLSKGNYNIFRIRFIKKIFNNSNIIVCIRNPYDVVDSSIKTHQNFLKENNINKYFDKEMKELCHFEFGKSRIKISNKKDYINDYDYYLNQWKEIYSMVYFDYSDIKSIHFFNFDKFLKDPFTSIQKLSKLVELNYSNEVNEYIELNVKKKRSEIKSIKETDIDSLYQKLLEKCIN